MNGILKIKFLSISQVFDSHYNVAYINDIFSKNTFYTLYDLQCFGVLEYVLIE
jgi:hypothetical protein